MILYIILYMIYVFLHQTRDKITRIVEVHGEASHLFRITVAFFKNLKLKVTDHYN